MLLEGDDALARDTFYRRSDEDDEPSWAAAADSGASHTAGIAGSDGAAESADDDADEESDLSENEEEEEDEEAPTATARGGDEHEARRALWSSRFQWLPAEVAVDAMGGCRFVSYINNLPLPSAGGSAYTALGAVLTRFLPLFEHVLARATDPASQRPRIRRAMPDVDKMRVRSGFVKSRCHWCFQLADRARAVSRFRRLIG